MQTRPGFIKDLLDDSREDLMAMALDDAEVLLCWRGEIPEELFERIDANGEPLAATPEATPEATPAAPIPVATAASSHQFVPSAKPPPERLPWHRSGEPPPPPQVVKDIRPHKAPPSNVEWPPRDPLPAWASSKIEWPPPIVKRPPSNVGLPNVSELPELATAKLPRRLRTSRRPLRGMPLRGRPGSRGIGGSPLRASKPLRLPSRLCQSPNRARPLRLSPRCCHC